MKSKTIQIRISEETYKYLQKLAKVNNSTVSEVVRWKIEKPKPLRNCEKKLFAKHSVNDLNILTDWR